jgi:hypothetical protein
MDHNYICSAYRVFIVPCSLSCFMLVKSDFNVGLCLYSVGEIKSHDDVSVVLRRSQYLHCVAPYRMMIDKL